MENFILNPRLQIIHAFSWSVYGLTAVNDDDDDMNILMMLTNLLSDSNF